MQATTAKPTSALWNRLADLGGWEARDLSRLQDCMRDLESRCYFLRGDPLNRQRLWILKRVARFEYAESERILEAMREVREGKDY